MAEPNVPGRLRWAVQLLDVAPDDQILEIGPGPGVSVALVCERLTGGRITAIDRSATAIERATRRNAHPVAAGKVVFKQLDLADAELELLKDLLRPGGALHLVYDPPATEQADRVTEVVTAALADHGVGTEVRAGAGRLLGIVGRR